jgi:hypothetical protein
MTACYDPYDADIDDILDIVDIVDIVVGPNKASGTQA